EKKYVGGEFFIFDFEEKGELADVEKAIDAAASGLFDGEKMIVFLQPLSMSEQGQEKLTRFLKEQKGSEEKNILLFVQSGKVKKGNVFMKLLQKEADTEEAIESKSGRDEENFIKKELKRMVPDMTMSADAMVSFLASTEKNSAKRMSELEKLASYKGSGIIEKEDVELLVVGPKESVVFSALDALGKGEKKQALLLFHREAQNNDGVFPLLSLCAWQTRNILRVREAFDRGIRRPGDIASATKLHPFVVQKILNSLPSFPLERLKNGLTLLSALDTDLKLGKKDPAVALDLFIWKF